MAADTPKGSKDQGILCDDPEKEQVSNDGTRQEMACRTAGASSTRGAVKCHLGSWSRSATVFGTSPSALFLNRVWHLDATGCGKSN